MRRLQGRRMRRPLGSAHVPTPVIAHVRSPGPRMRGLFGPRMRGPNSPAADGRNMLALSPVASYVTGAMIPVDGGSIRAI